MKRPKRLVTKAELDERVARHCGFSFATVSRVTRALMVQINDALVHEGSVRLDGVGILHVNIRPGGGHMVLTRGTFKKGERGARVFVPDRNKKYVVFRKAEALTQALKQPLPEE